MRLFPLARSLGRTALAASMALVAVASVSPVIAQEKAATGTIKGRLVWAAGPIPPVKVDVKKGDAKVKDAVCKVKEIESKDLTVDPKTMGVADSFAYLLKPTGDYSATEKAMLEKTPEVVIDQVACEFVPYVALVHKDQKLKFKSSDPVGHNVHFDTFSSGAINQMLPPNGSMVYPIKKEEKRPIKLVCDIHPWMKGYFMILEHPFAAVTGTDGSFEIKGVPAGAQTLILWQSTRGYVNAGGSKGMAVTVKAGEITDVGDIKIMPK